MKLAVENKLPRFNLEDTVKNRAGERITINRIEKINGAIEVRYNGLFWESELSPLVEQVKTVQYQERPIPLFAFEHIRTGAVTFKTRPFTGNQFIRPISLEGYTLA